MGQYDKEKAKSIEIAHSLADIHRSHLKKNKLVQKKGDDGYTRSTNLIYCIVDIKSQKKALKLLEKDFAGDAVMAEENTPQEMKPFENNDPSNRCWILDPLDGSVSYLKNRPFFGVVVGFVHNGNFALSLLYSTLSKTMYIAERGEGVKKFDPAHSKGIEVRIQDTPDSPQAGDRVHVTGFSDATLNALNDRGSGIVFQHVTNFCSIDRTVQVLEGGHKAYLKNRGNIFGLGPESFLIQEAGGEFITTEQKPPKWHMYNPPSTEVKRVAYSIDDVVILGSKKYTGELAEIVNPILKDAAQV